mgnify:CR=1 FL=1
MKHKTLVPSSIVAAMAVTAPALTAGAATSIYNTQASFNSNATGSLVWSEGFSAYTPSGGFGSVSSPVSGLGDGSVSMSSSLGSLSTIKGNYYFGHITSTVMGVIENRQATLSFANGVDSVGMEMYGTSTFSAGYFSEINYIVYAVGGGVLASGSVTGNGGSTSAYLGVVSDTPIGSLKFWGTQFSGALTSAIYADNVRGFQVPAPGAASVLGVAGLAAVRRRRR